MVGRVLELRRPGESSAEFARRLGVEPQFITNWENGQESLNVSTLTRIVENTRVDALYLLTGQGSAEPAGEAREAIERIWEITERIRQLIPRVQLAEPVKRTVKKTRHQQATE